MESPSPGLWAPRPPPGAVPFDPEDNLFLLPGPVKVHPRVREAMARAAMAHRGAEFTEVNRRLFENLRRLMGTKHVAVLAGSGTAGMDAAVSGLVHWNDRAVGLDNGEFGARMSSLVERYAGPAAVRLKSPWGQGHDLAALEAELQKGGVSAVCFTLNESSTGVMNQGREIARLCRKHDALCIADTITATGSVPVPFEEWGLDVSIVGSQKCIGGPAGLAFVAVSERAYARLDSPSFYLDLKKHVDRAEKENQTPYTPAVPLHLACVTALDMLFAEGLETRFQRTRRVAETCRAAAEAAGLGLAADAGVRSDTLTAIRYPAGAEDAKFRSTLKDRFNVVVAGAQGEWKGKVFRVGHMAGTTWTEMAAAWSAIEAAFRHTGHPIRSPSAALQDFS